MKELLWYIFELVINAIECWIIIDFLIRYFGFKDHFGKVRYWGTALFFVFVFTELTFVNSLTIFEGVAILIPVILYTGFCCVMLKGRIFSKAIICCLVFASILSINALIMSLSSVISNQQIINLLSLSNIYRAIPVIITKIVFFDLTRIVLKYKHKDKFDLGIKDGLISVAIPVMSIFTIILIWDISLYSTDIKPIQLLLPILAVIVTNIVVYYLINELNKEHKTQLELTMIKQQQEYYMNEINNISGLYDTVQSLKHDFSHYASTLYQLIHDKKYQEAEAYVEAYVSIIKNIPSYIATSNPILNSIVNTKLALAVSKGIEIKYYVMGELGSITEYDLSMLIGNLFDNALEHTSNLIDAKECEKPCIKFSITNRKSYLVINIQNTITSSVLQDNPNLLTTKQDHTNHGIGIKSIRNIAERYDGIIDFYEEGGFFCCNVSLKSSI